MEFAKVEISVPKDMTAYMDIRNPEDELKRNALILYPYINDLTISHGRAAEMLGISKIDLIELYGSMGLSYLKEDISEVEEELETFRGLKEVTI